MSDEKPARDAAASPRRHEVHADAPEETSETTIDPTEEKSPAEWAYERLILYIRDFEAQLDSEHEVAMGFTGGDVGVLRIEGMGFFDPDMITFYGTDADGARTQYIQHVSQLSVMLRALPKPLTEKEPRRIGFRLAQGLEKA
ncbi:DUF6173 family protein [Lutimaribacter sp. EGI FJ00015]|uniref:DUF6173 family protein n=1 Tax=Lutimaribacter degradans TaxID=2945989 RepID=A0ACC5ZUC9_9RHOB|nr:DUF6173 family protein [Lutimaribacter sp. EGI FJ00013]MCM2561558.1 DUF6173 family protein [Lutimaribacter sp. EGI FJ00013]MCO0612731.1 DUF6173 family protein [Lutimaribacter sp. EGI FJ00015]MCO0635389.1 DUF6173 family protein [Lutimaribacter sp. EGI FJ00014]